MQLELPSLSWRRESAAREDQMAIMIPGGTGFLGSYLARHLMREKGIAGEDLILFER
jgi:short subunit dehydrogenase-like uncharacterized protein